MTMDFVRIKNSVIALVQQNGISVIIVFIIVIHGLTTKLLGWLNGGAEKATVNAEVAIKDDDVEEDPPAVEDGDMVPYKCEVIPHGEMVDRSKEFYQQMDKRRSVRFFSDKDVPMEVIENCIKVAGTSPSGAHTQPWTYVVIKDQEIKEKIRDIVETEEKINYEKRMSKKWVEDLQKFKTNWQKPYLTTVPYLIVVFKQAYGLTEDQKRLTHYYSEKSIGLSCGLLLAAIQNAGLCTLTSTPLNADTSIRKLLNRCENEKLYLLLPVGYAADDCMVPDLKRKPLDEIMVYY